MMPETSFANLVVVAALAFGVPLALGLAPRRWCDFRTSCASTTPAARDADGTVVPVSGRA